MLPIHRSLEVDFYKWWQFIGFDSISEYADIFVIKELGHKADFCYFNFWHTLDHLMNEMKCFESMANDSFIVALDNACYAKII